MGYYTISYTKIPVIAGNGDRWDDIIRIYSTKTLFLVIELNERKINLLGPKAKIALLPLQQP